MPIEHKHPLNWPEGEPRTASKRTSSPFNTTRHKTEQQGQPASSYPTTSRAAARSPIPAWRCSSNCLAAAKSRSAATCTFLRMTTRGRSTWLSRPCARSSAMAVNTFRRSLSPALRRCRHRRTYGRFSASTKALPSLCHRACAANTSWKRSEIERAQAIARDTTWPSSWKRATRRYANWESPMRVDVRKVIETKPGRYELQLSCGHVKYVSRPKRPTRKTIACGVCAASAGPRAAAIEIERREQVARNG